MYLSQYSHSTALSQTVKSDNNIASGCLGQWAWGWKWGILRLFILKTQERAR